MEVEIFDMGSRAMGDKRMKLITKQKEGNMKSHMKTYYV